MSEQSPKIDPWEARDRERERWNNRRRSHRARSSSDGAPPEGATENGVSENYLVFGILAGIGLLLIGQIPNLPDNSRLLLSEAGALLLILLLGLCRRFTDPMIPALLRGPNPFLILLGAWSVYSLFASPYRIIAAAELLRIGSGIAIYFLAAYVLRGTKRQAATLIGILVFGVIIALVDFIQTGRGQVRTDSFDANNFSILGTHGVIGSLLVLLVPVALSFALHPDIEEKRRLAALGAAIILGAALMASRTRSAWVGAIFAFGVIAYFFFRYSPREEAHPQRHGGFIAKVIGSPATIIAIGFLGFAIFAGLSTILKNRAGTITDIRRDPTFIARVNMWNGAALMNAEKPLTGWGLGGYMVLQSFWTHDGDEPGVALQRGVDQRNMAHNYYFQWAADTGVIGLFLYGAAVTAFLLAAFAGVKQVYRTPFQLCLLSSSVAAVVGALVDALASPAYHFHGVHAIFWLWLGLGVAALRHIPRNGDQPAPALSVTPWGSWAVSLLGGALMVASVLLWSSSLQRQGRNVPRGRFEIIDRNFSPIRVGAPSVWTAHFQDEKGVARSTYPGTLWRTITDPETEKNAQAWINPDTTVEKTVHSLFRFQVSALAAPTQPVVIQATYRDQYGRLYIEETKKAVR